MAHAVRVVFSTTHSPMKKITLLLSLASLSLGLNAAAATTELDEQVTTLAAFTVTAERHTEGEKAIAQSLAEFRAETRATAQPVRTELPALGTVAEQAQPETVRALAVSPALALRGRS